MTRKTAQTTKRFPADDEIKGENLLTLSEKLGSVEMELNQPVEMEGDQPDIRVITVEAPTTDNMLIYDNRDPNATPEEKAKIDAQFYGSCCVNIPADKVSTFHVMDTRRLQRLVTNFV